MYLGFCLVSGILKPQRCAESLDYRYNSNSSKYCYPCIYHETAMASQNKDFIKILVAEGNCQTTPVDQAKRLPVSEIEIVEEKHARQVVSQGQPVLPCS